MITTRTLIAQTKSLEMALEAVALDFEAAGLGAPAIRAQIAVLQRFPQMLEEAGVE